MQLNDLKIKALIDLVAYKEDEIVPVWKKDMAYYNIPLLPDMGVELDFDEINRTIDQLNQEGKTPILIYCKVKWWKYLEWLDAGSRICHSLSDVQGQIGRQYGKSEGIPSNIDSIDRQVAIHKTAGI